MARNGSFKWFGDKIRRKAESAVGSAAIAWGETVVSEEKQRVHRLTGTLSRSLHVATDKYNGTNDERIARSGVVTTQQLGGIPRWVAGKSKAKVAAGSWISYAGDELKRGGTHDYQTAAVRIANNRFPRTMALAFRREFF